MIAVQLLTLPCGSFTEHTIRCQLLRLNNIEFDQCVTSNKGCVLTERSADTPHSANISALDLKSKRGRKYMSLGIYHYRQLSWL